MIAGLECDRLAPIPHCIDVDECQGSLNHYNSYISGIKKCSSRSSSHKFLCWILWFHTLLWCQFLLKLLSALGINYDWIDLNEVFAYKILSFVLHISREAYQTSKGFNTTNGTMEAVKLVISVPILYIFLDLIILFCKPMSFRFEVSLFYTWCQETHKNLAIS